MSGGPFRVELEVLIRPCRREDLPALEWFGLFAHERRLFRRMYRRHLSGLSHLLTVEANGEPSGQAWLDLDRYSDRRAAVLWAVRLLPCLQNLGIGTRLVAAGEEEARRRGFPALELSVEPDNPGALRLYRRLGYREGNSPPLAAGGSRPADTGQVQLWKSLRGEDPAADGGRGREGPG